MKRVGIIGAGHNGLVAACYLAKAGFEVTIFERRDIVGGLCVTEELFAGCKVSTLASRHGMLRKSIIRDLNIEAYGFQPYRPHHASYFIQNGDAINYPCGTREMAGEVIYKVKDLQEKHRLENDNFWNDVSIAVGILAKNQNNIAFTQDHFVSMLREKKLNVFADLVFSGSLMDVAQSYISHPSLAATAASMNFGHPCANGSFYEMLYLGTAESFEKRGQWGFIKGGMGIITQALAKEASASGVTICLKSDVSKIETNKKGHQIILSDGASHIFDYVISSTDPFTLYTKFIKDLVPKKIKNAASQTKSSLSKAVLHLKLDAMPDIPDFARIGRTGEYAFWGQCDFVPTIENTINSYQAHQSNKTPFGTNSMVISNLITAMDDSLTRDCSHVWTLVHYFCPSEFEDGSWTQKGRDYLYSTTLEILRPYVTNLDNIIEDFHLITPDDLRDTYGLNSLSPAHVDLTPEHILEKRPMNIASGYETIVPGIYICGSGTSPGPMVTGIPGQNCANVIISKEKELLHVV